MYFITFIFIILIIFNIITILLLILLSLFYYLLWSLFKFVLFIAIIILVHFNTYLVLSTVFYYYSIISIITTILLFLDQLDRLYRCVGETRFVFGLLRVVRLMYEGPESGLFCVVYCELMRGKLFFVNCLWFNDLFSLFLWSTCYFLLVHTYFLWKSIKILGVFGP